MARIPYAPMDVAEPAELVAAIRKRRGGKLLNLDRMLLRSPGLAAGWNVHLGAVRTGLTLDPKLREIAMCVVAVINGADYEFIQHAPVFSASEQAAIALTVEMTRKVRVQDATFAAVRAHLSEQQTVELVGVIATYNMVSRFLVALGVEPE
jgi:alkylhydroperoxidase family enzyme